MLYRHFEVVERNLEEILQDLKKKKERTMVWLFECSGWLFVCERPAGVCRKVCEAGEWQESQPESRVASHSSLAKVLLKGRLLGLVSPAHLHTSVNMCSLAPV